MVKTGPCLHCGIDFTPLWRNGPEDKPVLCNACGSRYRLCGSLENYFPKHFEPKHLNNLTNVKDGSNLKVRNKSSSYVSDSDGENPSLWNTMIPSKKRSRVVYKQMTPMKKFQKQLLNMWRYYRKSNESSPEEVLLSNKVNNFIPNNEIGLGVILLKPHGTST